MPHSYYSKQLPCAWKLIALDTTELSGHSCYPGVWLLLRSVLSGNAWHAFYCIDFTV